MLSPVLFHASTKEMPTGHRIVADRPAAKYREVVALLEKSRPVSLPSRDVCVFASDNPVAAVRFLMSENVPFDKVKLYRVSLTSYHKAPFCLVHEIHRRLTATGRVESLVDEYWAPNLSWRFWEFFGPFFEVVEIAKPVSFAQAYAFGFTYESDINQAKLL